MSKRLNMNIRNFRIFKGMTQEDLANRIGKSKNVISNWERGDNSPDIDCIEKICNIMGVTPNQLFGWEPYKEYEDYKQMMDEKKMELEILQHKKNQLQSEIDSLKDAINAEAAKFKIDAEDEGNDVNGDPKTSE